MRLFHSVQDLSADLNFRLQKKRNYFICTDIKRHNYSSPHDNKNGQLLPLIKNTSLIPGINFSEAVKLMGSSVYYINSIMGEKML